MNRRTANAGAYRTGETGLIIKVSEAEPAVGAWRSQFFASVQLIAYSGGCWTEVRSFSLANID